MGMGNNYPCPYCGQPRGKNWEKDLRKRQSEGIKTAYKENKASGGRWGRAPKANYKRVYELRDMGFSTYQIAIELGISRGSVQNALRKRTNPPTTEQQ